MLLYVHVPFCRRRCSYCAFHSSAIGQGEIPKDYAQTVLKELSLRSEHIPQEKRLVSSVFFGGGTPSLLSPNTLGILLNGMAKLFPFEGDAEISLEGNPESLCEPSKLKGFFAAGVNRLSLGVQSMNNDTLKRLGRIHGVEEVELAIKAARKAGFNNVGMDLIWALPNQKPEDWKQNLKKALVLEPEHLSAYSLSIEEGTPLYAENLRSPLNLPSEEEQEEMYVEGTALIEAAGLKQYEISNYAKQGRRCRHNMGYWKGEEYLGLGPAAVSTLKGIRQTNPVKFENWRAWTDGGARSNEAEDLERIDRKTAILEFVMLSLRTSDGVSFKEYTKRTGRDFKKDFWPIITPLEKGGHIQWTEEGLALSLQGMLVSNAVIERFFEQIDNFLP